MATAAPCTSPEELRERYPNAVIDVGLVAVHYVTPEASLFVRFDRTAEDPTATACQELTALIEAL